MPLKFPASLRPRISTLPGLGAVERRLLEKSRPPNVVLAEPPPGSGLKPVLGDNGLPLLGHSIEFMRGGSAYIEHVYRTRGPVSFQTNFGITMVTALGPDATQAVFTNREKEFSQQGWTPIIGPFFHRGLMLLDHPEHLAHRHIMQEAFTRSALSGYVEHIDEVATEVVRGWPRNDPAFQFHAAAKDLTLDIAAVVFMGAQHGTIDHAELSRVNTAFIDTTRAGGAFIRRKVPGMPWLKWNKGLAGRTLLERFFAERIQGRRGSEGKDMLTVLCNAVTKEGQCFTDDDIVSHMIFLMMAAHDTSTSTCTTMAYYLAAHPEWQERARDESARLGDGPLDIDALDKLESLDLIMNESLRLVTPLPFNFRSTVRDIDLMGHHVPANSIIITQPGMNHRLAELWTEPDTFDPERFAEPRNEHKRHRYAFSPFGGGAHKCIGMVFGQLEIKAIMHRILREYRIELASPDYQPRWDHGGMPVPIDGMPLVLRPLRD
ncbi:cytochrome P450 [Segniliparus rotundus DSM 44985]|uniref:Cytochrome P450 n=1 Tax=Segniliparus rotundus (strain ATCC BAA-972 / CDC 1076 / CIP 108378 / DSM 44985 / JCM 13578) TaxID=640132 RepID=D6ZCC2_SEGRD|nr:cytochrome P450 [Segniliparus rotundus]ADG99091.1 cytochrome P450 [Segniliparus rotundus DSM 44985]